MKKPSRVRSQIIVIIYKAKLPLDKLVSYIQSLVKTNIKYIIKYEYYADLMIETIVYIDFKERPDIPTKKFEFDSADFSLWATNDDFWPLTMVLKLSDDDIKTNIEKAIIDKYIKKLRIGHNKKIKPRANKSKLMKLPELTDKAKNRIVSLIKKHKELLASKLFTEEHLQELNRCVTNATNYRYKYKIPEQLDEQISNMRTLMKE